MNDQFGCGQSYAKALQEDIVTLITHKQGIFTYSPYFRGEKVAGEVCLRLQGSRTADFRLANIRAGIAREDWCPFGYVWHHSYNPYFNFIKAKYRMQLVNVLLHARTGSHFGAYEQGKELKASHLRPDITGKYILQRNRSRRNEPSPERILLKRLHYDQTENQKAEQLSELQARFYPGQIMPEALYEFFRMHVRESFSPKVFACAEEKYMVASLFPVTGADSLQELIGYEKGRKTRQMPALEYARGSHVPFAGDGLGNLYFLKLEEGCREDAPVYFYNHELNCSEYICDGIRTMIKQWGELVW